MINKSWKKLLSVLLSVAMLLSLMPGIGLIASADTVSFTKVTDASQITAENIGTCTAEDAKAWALANWNVLLENSFFAEIAFYSNTGELYYVQVYQGLDEQSFLQYFDNLTDTTSISDLQTWFNDGHSVFICTPAAAPAVSFTIVTDASQITADNIGACTFEDAKAWALANWNTVASTTAASFWVAYYDGADLKAFNVYPELGKDEFETKPASAATAVGIDDLTLCYNYSDDVWLCTPAAAPAAVTFTIVTNGDQVAADSIGECTFDEAKAWVYDNWDAVTNGVAPSKYIDIVYIVSGSARMIAFFTDECTDKDVFKLTIQSDFDADLAVIKDYYNSGSDVVYVCSKAATPAHVHSLTPHAAQNAGCTTAGNSAYWSCSCGMYFSDENGNTEIAENSWVIPALGHNYENVAYSSDDTQHWKVCSRCSEDSEKQNHTWGEATYTWSNDNSQVTARHTCTQCGKEVTETVDTTASVSGANCTEPERTTYTANFTKDGFVQQVKSGVQTGPALGHNYENVAYSSDDTQHWKVCSRCHEDSPKANHTWGEATYTWSNDNSQVTARHTCTQCGKEVTETVDTSSQVTAANCTTAELTTYTATFTKDGFVQQVKPDVQTGSALGHQFSYAGLNETIIATCSHDGCEYHFNGAFIIIHAPALTTYGGAESASATLEGVDAFNTATGLSVSENAIRYYNTKIEGVEILKDGAALTSAPTDAGTYWAEIKVQNATAYVVYTIAKADPIATAPTAEATYGDLLSDVTLTNAAGNTPGTWSWEDDPTTVVGDAGSRTFKATFTPTDTENYNVIEHVDVTVTVGKAGSTAASVAANEWTFDGATKPLVTVTGAAAGGTMAYALGTATEATGAFGDAIPEVKDPDTYYVWYKVVGDGNHNDTEPVCVTVVVAHDEELDAVIAAIDAIGPVTEVLADQKAKIDAARAGYEDLTPAQQQLVTNYATLTTAEADYKALFVYSASTQITVSGTERIGETLTATATDIPAFITDSVVRWYNEDGDLLGTGATYVIPESQIGKTIRAELYSAEAEDSVYSDYTGAVDKGFIKGYKLPTAAAIMYPQTLGDATLTGGDTGAVEGVWAWVLPDEKPTSAQNGALYAVTFTPTGDYAALYEVINAKIAIVVEPAPFEPQAVEDPMTGIILEAEFAQNVELELTDIVYSQAAYLALLRASSRDASPLNKLVMLKTIDLTVNGEATDAAYEGAVTVKSYVGEKYAGNEYSVWFFIDGAPVNYVGTVNDDGVLVIDGVEL